MLWKSIQMLCICNKDVEGCFVFSECIIETDVEQRIGQF